MDIIIPFSPSEEARVAKAAQQAGLPFADFVKQLALQHLPDSPESVEAEVDARLRLWQQSDGTVLMPDIPAQDLFAKWDAEDANMTNEERKAEAHLWEDLEQGLAANNRVLQIRQLGE